MRIYTFLLRKNVMRIYGKLKMSFLAQLCELIASHFVDGSAMGSVKVLGRDSGPKGAYAHQYLDRRHKTKTLKPKAILSF